MNRRKKHVKIEEPSEKDLSVQLPQQPEHQEEHCAPPVAIVRYETCRSRGRRVAIKTNQSEDEELKEDSDL